MDPFRRLSIAGRAYSLAAIVGMGLVLDNFVSLQVAVAIAFVAALGTYLSTASSLPVRWVITGEAALASLIVALTLPDSLLVLPYMVILALLGGLVAGITGASMIITVQLLLLLVLPLIEAGGFVGLTAQFKVIAPWTLTIASAGLMGALAKKSRRASTPPTEEAYESARRLLIQLRRLARRLSSGLDPVAVSEEILSVLHERLGDKASAVLARTDTSVIIPLAYRGADAEDRIRLSHPVLSRAWDPKAAVSSAPIEVGRQDLFFLVIPLLVGNGVAGVVLSVVDENASRVDPRLQEQLSDLSLRLETALAFDEFRNLVTTDERQRLAREIHDGIAQELASLGYSVDEIASDASDPAVREGLSRLRDDVSRLITELRLSIFDLRADLSQASGLGAALSDYVRSIGARSRMTVHLTLDEAPTRLTARTETELFRIAQEAITNARRHSEAKNLWVNCRVHPPEAVISIRDDGRGLRRGRRDSYGLRIMQERAERINANLEVSSTAADGDSGGTTVTVSVGRSSGGERGATINTAARSTVGSA